MRNIVTVLLTLLLLLPVAVLGQTDRVVVSFIGVNGYGNNLYVDNFSIGTQFGIDVAVASVNNIAPDTSYNTGTSNVIVAPKVSVLNVGLNAITSSFTVTFSATPGGYSSSRSITSLTRGQLQELTFDNLTIPLSTSMSFTVFTNLATDQNRLNDTLRQSTLILPGAWKKTLLEEWTSSTCAPCAANNPTIDAFIVAHFDSLSAVKYHVGWPSPGNDPMYLYNPTQSYDRRYYYNVNAVPNLIMDGIVNPAFPYYEPSSLPTAYARARATGSPLSLAVTDTRIPGDTVQANVTLTILSPLPAGSYRLRVHAIERKIHYASPPGTNGESDFFDVFRRAYPTSLGTSIPTTVGTHNFVFKYRVDTGVWVDSMIYTMVFVQNDLNKEVMNSAKARLAPGPTSLAQAPAGQEGKERCRDNATAGLMPSLSPPEAGFLQGRFHYEIFEGRFPPRSWRLGNPDGGITFERFGGVSGPSFGGVTAAKIDFYSYSTTGQTDTLVTPVLTGLRGSDSLTFDWAHAQYPGYTDRMIVKLSKDGGATFPYTVFDRSGATLATAPSTTSPFVPAASSEWGRFSYSLTGILSSAGEEQVPYLFGLAQNFPNPFNPGTEISYSLARPAEVDLRVYDLLGRAVSTLVKEVQPAGRHTVYFNASTLASGMYLYRITAGEFTSVKKMVLLR